MRFTSCVHELFYNANQGRFVAGCNLQLLKSGFDLVRSALGVAKDIKGLSGSPTEAAAAENKITEAERALALGEAQIAQALGYTLCKCTFPPQVMLRDHFEARYQEEVFRCQRCEAEQSPKEYFEYRRRQDVAVEAHNSRMQSEHSWME